MWVEVTVKVSGKKVLINSELVQSVYQGDEGVVIDFGGHVENFFVVKGDYEEIRSLISYGVWLK